jgi:hypothetical protein
MSLPEAGEVFAFAVSDGVEVLLRTLAVEAGAACVVMTTWSARGPLRRAKLPARFELQPLNHHGWNRPLVGAWVAQGPPAPVRALGLIAPRPSERRRVLHPKTWLSSPAKTRAMAARVLPVSQWATLLADVRAQWRWEHERERVVAEDARAELARGGALLAAVQQQRSRREALVRTGLRGLKPRRFFAAWRGALPAALITRAEALMQAAIAALEGKTPAQAAKRLSGLVRAFNRLDAAHGHRFGAPDAEDVMEAVGELALACGVTGAVFDAKIDAVREF